MYLKDTSKYLLRSHFAMGSSLKMARDGRSKREEGEMGTHPHPVIYVHLFNSLPPSHTLSLSHFLCILYGVSPATHKNSVYNVFRKSIYVAKNAYLKHT